MIFKPKFKMAKLKILNFNRQWSNKKLYVTSNGKIIKNTMQIETKPLFTSYNFKNLIIYRDGIINIKIGLITVDIKGKIIIINFNILLLGNNKAVLRML